MSFLLGKIKPGYILLVLILSILAVLWLMPLWFAVVTSFKYEAEIYGETMTWIPRIPTLYNYDYILSARANIQVTRWMLNSLFISGTHTLLLLFVHSLSAYAYARMHFKGRQFLFTVLTATMMIPGVINFIPNFVIVSRIGWLDTPTAMIIPGISGVFGIFLLRQFFLGIPKEIDESAKIDGAGDFRIYSQLIIPLAKPALIALAILTFLANWNDYLWPLIVTNRDEAKTLTLGVALLFSRYNYQRGVILAGTCLGAVAPAIFFIFGQRYFVQGITFAAVKE